MEEPLKKRVPFAASVLLCLALCALPALGTALALPHLPDTLPMHYDYANAVDRWGDKHEMYVLTVVYAASGLVLLGIALGVRRFGGWAAAQPRAPKTSAFQSRTDGAASCVFPRDTPSAAVVSSQAKAARRAVSPAADSTARALLLADDAMLLFFTLLHGGILAQSHYAALGLPVPPYLEVMRLSGAGMGLLLAALALFLPRLPRSSLAGVRTTASMASEEAWRESQRFGAKALFVGGAVEVLCAALPVPAALAFWLGFAALLTACAVCAWYPAHRARTSRGE